jgi:hypothetical protein
MIGHGQISEDAEECGVAAHSPWLQLDLVVVEVAGLPGRDVFREAVHFAGNRGSS